MNQSINQSGKHRNNYVELLRFLFTVCVIIAHYKGRYPDAPLAGNWNGHIGVEFFFVLSGFLMAAYCAKKENGQPVWQATWTFMGRKVSAIAPVYYTALLVVVVRHLALTQQKGMYLRTYLTRLLAPLLFLPEQGFHESSNIPFSWYIGAMMLAMLVLFPFLYRWRRTFCRVAAPIIVIFFCVHAMQTYEKLFLLHQEWLGFFFHSFLRAVGELSMGCFAYEISLCLQARYGGRMTAVGRTGFTLLNVVLFALPIWWLAKALGGLSHPFVLCMFALGIAISFSGLDYTGSLHPTLDALFGWMGKISLPLYLGQGIVMYYFPQSLVPTSQGIWCFLAACFAMAIALMLLSKLLVLICRTAVKLTTRVCIRSDT